jgi:hypothetical protein
MSGAVRTLLVPGLVLELFCRAFENVAGLGVTDRVRQSAAPGSLVAQFGNFAHEEVLSPVRLTGAHAPS